MATFERDFNILKQKDDPNMSEERLYMTRLPLNPGLPRVGTIAPYPASSNVRIDIALSLPKLRVWIRRAKAHLNGRSNLCHQSNGCKVCTWAALWP